MSDLLDRQGDLVRNEFEQAPGQMMLGEVCADFDLAIISMQVGAIALQETEAPQRTAISSTLTTLPVTRGLKIHADTLFRETFEVVKFPGEIPQIVVADRLALNQRILSK